MRSRLGALVAGLALVALAAIAYLFLRPPPPAPLPEGDPNAPPAAASTGELAAPLAAAPARIRGRVLLERPTSAAPAPTPPPEPREEPGPDGYDPSALDYEPGAAGPPVPLEPPALGTCRALAWRAGVRLGEAACDAEGGFLLELPVLEGEASAVAVEMLVPGYLRAVLSAPARAGVEALLPTVALGPASWLRGQVIDRRGEPVAGVSLTATPLPSLGEPEPWRDLSGPDGAFLFDTIPTGPIRLRATGPGLALSVVEAFAPEAGVVIVVDGLQDLSGDVVGAPELLARARVRLEGSSLWPPLEQATTPQGGFVFSDLVDGVYGLVAAVPAERPGDPEYASLPLENLAPGAHVSLALIAAGRVPVRVVDPDGAPVPGARVTLGYASVGLLQQFAETDAAGEARLGPTVPGPYVVRADADGFLPSEAIPVEVRVGGADPQLLTLVRPGRISGVVLDEGGLPVPEASIVVDADALYSPGEAMIRARTFGALQRGGSLGVTRGAVPPVPLLGDDEDDAAGWTQSDERGDFALELLLPGTYRLSAVHGEHAASAVVVVDLGPGARVEGVVLTLGHGVPLLGQVLDGNRRPIYGARVELEGGATVLTDWRGVFDAGRRRGRQRLIFRAPGMIPVVREVDLEDLSLPLEQVLQPAEGGLEGRVVDGNDRPIAGVRVTLLPDDGLTPTVVVHTDERGVFELGTLAPGSATLELDHPSYAPTSRPVRVPKLARSGRPLEAKLELGWELEIVVREVGSGDPIVGARVDVAGQVWATDDAGEVHLHRLAGARVSVSVRATGYVAAAAEASRPGEGRASLVLDLDEASGIEGRVTDERGEPVARARVVVRTREGGAVLAEASTSSDGRWSISGLPEGDVEVEAIPPPGLADLLAPVTLQSDVRRGHTTREVDLRFDRL